MYVSSALGILHRSIASELDRQREEALAQEAARAEAAARRQSATAPETKSRDGKKRNMFHFDGHKSERVSS